MPGTLSVQAGYPFKNKADLSIKQHSSASSFIADPANVFSSHSAASPGLNVYSTMSAQS